MRAEKPERMLQVEWSSGAQMLMEVELVAFAYDRRGLVRDITDVVAQEHLSIEGMNTHTDEDRIARVGFRLGRREPRTAGETHQAPAGRA